MRRYGEVQCAFSEGERGSSNSQRCQLFGRYRIMTRNAGCPHTRRKAISAKTIKKTRSARPTVCTISLYHSQKLPGKIKTSHYHRISARRDTEARQSPLRSQRTEQKSRQPLSPARPPCAFPASPSPPKQATQTTASVENESASFALRCSGVFSRLAGDFVRIQNEEQVDDPGGGDESRAVIPRRPRNIRAGFLKKSRQVIKDA